MDQVTAPGRGKIAAARIRRAGLESGIGPEDQLAPLIEELAALPEALEALTTGLSGDLRQLLEEAKAQATGDIARRAIAELPRHAGQLVKTEHHKLVWRTAGLLMLMFIAGGTTLAAWQWLYGKPLLVSCDPRRAPDDQCYYQKKGNE